MKAVPYNQRNGGHKGFVPKRPTWCHHQCPLNKLCTVTIIVCIPAW